MRAHFIGYYTLSEDLEERMTDYGTIVPSECARLDMNNTVETPIIAFALCDETQLVSIQPVIEGSTIEGARKLLGKVVNVRLGEHRPNELLDGGETHCQCGAELPCDKLGKRVIARGKLLGFGTDGSFELLQNDGQIHWCWPMLEIHEFPEGQTETEGE